MGNVSRMSGSAWHIEVLKSDDENKARRWKCKFFDRKEKVCRCKRSRKYLLTCLTVLECDFYEEGKFVSEKKKVKTYKENEFFVPKETYAEIEAKNKDFIPIEKKKSVKGIALIGDNVEIESLDGKITKTFRLLDKDKNGKYNAITNACKEKHLNDVIKYKNKEYRIIKIERIKK